MKYLINFISGKISKTSTALGLNLNKKDFIYGFTVESAELELAEIQLNSVVEKWSKWVDTYNQWSMLADKSKWTPVKLN